MTMKFQRVVTSLFFQVLSITLCPFFEAHSAQKSVLARYHVPLLMGSTEFIMLGLR